MVVAGVDEVGCVGREPGCCVLERQGRVVCVCVRTWLESRRTGCVDLLEEGEGGKMINEDLEKADVCSAYRIEGCLFFSSLISPSFFFFSPHFTLHLHFFFENVFSNMQ
jgi:hypothetical protein